MSVGDVVALMRDGVFQILTLVAPVLGAALIIGLVVAIFQATTSIQEQTLTFAPKFFVILAVLALLGGWMFTSMREYTIQIFQMISVLGR
ncbi:MAG: flagellar biosynthesis protein FliQ [Treponema sp.]|nr:flagellar biosynthesis protein FliQ [Spirochaetaceae bacterium]MCI6664162.1 flagellar biosynthesis protein FliQ [Spirochaetia bacterium]MDD7274780.1 flagellar biosynthesis protein FliQ [Treponema sp.]MDY3755116.1 flagellar biosynthesis protein FliQ [Treponema sp.]MDY4674398.1 flagellar biosynthesis protein FliQ [Treponema sp.]